MKTLDAIRIRQHPRFRSRSLKLVIIGTLIIALALPFESIRMYGYFGVVVAAIGNIIGAIGTSISIKQDSLAYGTATIPSELGDIAISVTESGIRIVRPKKRELNLRETNYHPEDWPIVTAFFRDSKKQQNKPDMATADKPLC
ncbi:hypothetical protein ACFQY0_17020 [Haloferula chungangensis]|uniref:Uncharacterized protein n=1 Tax=Haloferula chungangensis TaxID=1048331 RepID=A0ABW2LDM0_9BACT